MDASTLAPTLGLIPLLPLLGFVINGFWYAFGQAPAGRKKAGSAVTGTIATVAIFASFLLSLAFFLELRGLAPEARVINQTLFSWISVDDLKIDAGLRLDSLSTLFTLVITGVGTLIHLYSIGYMTHDATPGRFFAYLNLFCFAMLVLVLGSSLPMMFVGWEGVGLCSYLLISYWYTNIENAKAGKKAFVVNRIGDFGFLLGMFLIFATFGTLDFSAIQATVAQQAGLDPSTVTAICLLLFVGCMGKSAQIPLYVWLPDAMAGPTPVSALIHAATMVTSGIYLVSRMGFLYSLSQTALMVVAVVGAFTAFFAATIAVVQTDIKKVLAYSTISQLGYMFLGCGVGAYAAGVFHVITHAFFKALLFLGAGSVIHGMHEQQDILKMGGLRKKMPITFATFLVGWLAICGIPPFAGFFSKDEILWKAFSSPFGSAGLWFVGVFTAVLTAFYMTRLFSLTFLGKPRFEAGDDDHGHATNHGANVAHIGHGHGGGDHAGHSAGGVHESPWSMTVPLIVLAILSAAGGLLGWPHASWIEQWLEPVLPHHEGIMRAGSEGMEFVLMGVSVAGALFGVFIGLGIYRDLKRPMELARKFALLHKTLWNKWYIDEIYEAIFVRPIRVISEGLWKGFDIGVIDRIVLGFGRASQMAGQAARTVQTGSLQVYALILLTGLIAAAGYLVYGIH